MALVMKLGLASIFPYTFYHLTYYWFAAVDIPVANDTVNTDRILTHPAKVKL
ncbi:hypothetical protein ACZ87_03402, partial [Candidatus Erwinia dacicola]